MNRKVNISIYFVVILLTVDFVSLIKLNSIFNIYLQELVIVQV